MWKGFKEFFHYTKSQRNGIILLLIIAVALQLGLYLKAYWPSIGRSYDFSEFEKYAKEWNQSQVALDDNDFQPFYFDPNQTSDSAWQILGLSKRNINTINNYLSKGGQFRKPDDLSKIYGLDSSWFASIRDYIVIKDKREKSAKSKNFAPRFNFEKFDPNQISKEALMVMGLRDWQAKGLITYREKVKPFRSPEQLFTVYSLDSFIVEKMLPYIAIDTASLPEIKERKSPVADISVADSATLSEVWGVSGYLARNIIKYRGRLGGYYSIEQIREVYGVDEDRYLKIKPNLELREGGITKLDINKASFKELLRHPYLEYDMVKSIVYFRENTRPFKKIDELQYVEGIDKKLLKKLEHYLKVD